MAKVSVYPDSDCVCLRKMDKSYRQCKCRFGASEKDILDLRVTVGLSAMDKRDIALLTGKKWKDIKRPVGRPPKKVRTRKRPHYMHTSDKTVREAFEKFYMH